ncbi:MAG: GWxTD domain-containing protein [bacterium]
MIEIRRTVLSSFSMVNRKIHIFLALFWGIFLTSIFTCTVPPKDKAVPKEFSEDRIQKLHDRAQRYFDSERFDRAEAVLDSILSIRSDAEAYLSLGRIYAKREGQHRKAEMYYKQAMQLKRRFVKAYYALAMLYKEGPYLKQDAIDLLRWTTMYDKNFKDAYYQRAVLYFQYNKAFTSGLRQLEKLLILDPAYKDSYALYRSVVFTFHKHGRMSRFFKEMVSCYPDSGRFRLDLAHALHRDGQYSEAQACFDSLKERRLSASPALRHLYEARNLFALSRDTVAHDAYWQGIAAISSEDEVKEFFNDLIYIVTDEEFDEFMQGTVAQKKSCIAVCWKSRDPILVTPYNERLSEHFARLRFARKRNRRYPVMELLSNLYEDFPEPVEDSPILARFSKTMGSKIQQEVDDCGLIYIRHGEPDDQETFIGGSDVTVDKNLSWIYRAKPGRPEMTFHFRFMQHHWSQGYMLELQSKYQSERFFATGRGPESIEIGTSTTTTNVTSEYGRFDFPFCNFCFKGDEGLEDVFVYYDLPSEARPDRKSPAPFTLRHEMVVFDSEWNEIQRIDTTESAASMRFDAAGRMTRKIHRRLPAGGYFSGIRLTNEQTKREGALKVLLKVPSSAGPGLMMTDMMLADAAVNENLLQLGEYEHSIARFLVPNVERRFREGEPVVVYFEIYGLRLHENRTSDFQIRLRIRRVKVFASALSKFFSKLKNFFTKDQTVQIAVEDAYSGKRSDEFITRSLDLPDSVQGEYELYVRVTDRIARTSIEKKVDFTIVE